ncbi:hypothetical protein [uncultured Clostridium sp.]|uniref:hyaluronate lyase N-terminal domain-containing protein n=1 Tax=uncultured Clostridium sp. TaxID=59620 RepID=UPI003217CCA3
MANKIQIKRGLKSKLPILLDGELGLCTDTKEVFVGNGGINVDVTNKTSIDVLNTEIMTARGSDLTLDERLDGIDLDVTENFANIDIISAKTNTISPKNTSQTRVVTSNVSSDCVFDRLFFIEETDNMQGVTFYNGFYYIGFDIGTGNGRISKYASDGKKIDDSGILAIGHCAELSFRIFNEHIYVANGGGTNPTHIYEVSYNTKTIVKDYDFSTLGTSALVAIDNLSDKMLVHTSTSGDIGNHVFTFVEFDTGNVISTFNIPNQGVPQGLEIIDGYIYLYTNNKITIMDFQGTIKNLISIPKDGESEGLCLASNYGSSFLAIGYNTPNRIYSFRTVESEKFTNIKPINSFNSTSRHDKDLLPRITYFGIRKISGVWTYLDWSNYINAPNNIESISVVDNIIKVKLKTKYDSVAFVDTNPDQNLFQDKFTTHGQLNADGYTIDVRIYDMNNNINVNPTTILDFRGITGYIIGGVDMRY